MRGFHFHCYRDLKSWAVCLSLTIYNAAVQLGPFRATLIWKESF